MQEKLKKQERSNYISWKISALTDKARAQKKKIIEIVDKIFPKQKKYNGLKKSSRRKTKSATLTDVSQNL